MLTYEEFIDDFLLIYSRRNHKRRKGDENK